MKSYLHKGLKLLIVSAACAVLVSCGEPESNDNAYPSQADGQAAYQTADEQTNSPDISSADTSESLFQYMPFSVESGYTSEEKDIYPSEQNDEKTADTEIVLTPMNK